MGVSLFRGTPGAGLRGPKTAVDQRSTLHCWRGSCEAGEGGHPLSRFISRETCATSQQASWLMRRPAFADRISAQHGEGAMEPVLSYYS